MITWGMDACQIDQQVGEGIGHELALARLDDGLIDFRMLDRISMGAIDPERDLELVMG